MKPHQYPPLLQCNDYHFPDIATAQQERDGLVAIGGDLSVPRLLSAYGQGIFPWFDEYHPILWWAFAERMVLKPEALRYGRSLHKALRNRPYCITVNQAFSRVIRRCARTYRPTQNGTWLTQNMQAAYIDLHRQGFAHSFEYWHQGADGRWCLGGGLYGVLIGQIFFGESMFTHVDDASKIAFIHSVHFLRTLGVPLIDCQVHSEHLARFGAETMPFDAFRQYLDTYCANTTRQTIKPGLIASNKLPANTPFTTTQ